MLKKVEIEKKKKQELIIPFIQQMLKNTTAKRKDKVIIPSRVVKEVPKV